MLLCAVQIWGWENESILRPFIADEWGKQKKYLIDWADQCSMICDAYKELPSHNLKQSLIDSTLRRQSE